MSDNQGPSDKPSPVEKARRSLAERVEMFYGERIKPVLPDIDKITASQVDGLRDDLYSLIFSADDEFIVLVDEFITKINASEAAWATFQAKVDYLSNEFKSFEAENPDLDPLESVFSEGIPGLVKIWDQAALMGWYIPIVLSFSVITSVLRGQDAVDDFMLRHLTRKFDELRDQVLKKFPERAHILKEAFLLHQSGNYVASIPLLLAQADGICAQNLGGFLFTERDRRSDKVSRIISDGVSEVKGAFLSALVLKTQVGSPIDHSTNEQKSNGPNRNGIFHGSRKHLDYGTELNSWKALSLLLFVSFLFSTETGFI